MSLNPWLGASSTATVEKWPPTGDRVHLAAASSVDVRTAPASLRVLTRYALGTAVSVDVSASGALSQGHALGGSVTLDVDPSGSLGYRQAMPTGGTTSVDVGVGGTLRGDSNSGVPIGGSTSVDVGVTASLRVLTHLAAATSLDVLLSGGLTVATRPELRGAVGVNVGLADSGFRAAAPPENDSFAAPVVLTGTSGTYAGQNYAATAEPGEPLLQFPGYQNPDQYAYPPSHSVWFEWTATENGGFRFGAYSDTYSTVVNVFTGSTLDSLTIVAGSDEYADFRATAGTTYRIRVDGYDEGGSFSFVWHRVEVADGHLYSWDRDDSGKLRLDVDVTGRLRVNVAPTPPPPGIRVEPIRQRAVVYSSRPPLLDSLGRPVTSSSPYVRRVPVTAADSFSSQSMTADPSATGPQYVATVPLTRAVVNPNGTTTYEIVATGEVVDVWEPTETVEREIGSLQVVMGGVDMTFFRGIPALVRSWAKNEPFGDATAEIHFPQVSVFERISHGDLIPLGKGQDVDINLIRTDGSKKTVFEGFVIGKQHTYDGVTVEVLGALYQADLQLQPPPFYVEATDIGERIADLLDGVVSRNYAKCNRPVTGILTRQRGSWQNRLSGGVQDMLAVATTDDGLGQWTVTKLPGRVPSIELKDRTTQHWTVTTGAPGVTVEMQDDASTAPNVIYGEGVDPEGCIWRNSKYPNLRLDDAPSYPYGSASQTIGVGDSGPEVVTLKDELRTQGYAVTAGDVYRSADAAAVRLLQSRAGLRVDGVVGPQTWAATFDVGANGGDLSGAFFMPLFAWDRVEPNLYAGNGATLGTNATFEPGLLRVERYENFGEGLRRTDGERSAYAEWRRDFFPEGQNFHGSIRLASDPHEGSRFEIEAGQNIRLQLWNVRNNPGNGDGTLRDSLYHISAVRADPIAGTVELTVDTRARDAITLGSILKRKRDATDPARRTGEGARRRSRNTQDSITVWDCESGAGRVPRHALFRNLWTVIRIPAGQAGTVVKSEFTTDSPAARFALGVFSRRVTPADLLRLVGNPFGEVVNDRSPWQRDPDALLDAGLLISWGTVDQPCGIYPGTAADTDPTTGRFVDGASWEYESDYAPWLWVAEYSTVSTFISGRFYPGIQV